MQITILDQWYDLHILNGNHKIEFRVEEIYESNCYANFSIYLINEDIDSSLPEARETVLKYGRVSIKDYEGVEEINNVERRIELKYALDEEKVKWMKLIMASIKADGVVNLF